MGLLDFFFGSKPTPPAQPGLLSSAAAPAAGALTNRAAYMDYVEQTQTKGGQALAYPDWVKAQQAKPPVPAPKQ